MTGKCICLFMGLLLTRFLQSAPIRKTNPVHTDCIVQSTNKYGKYVCAKNDTYCGDWDLTNRLWKPVGCSYREVSTQQARKCFVNKTIGCIGDSQTRDFCIGLGLLLSGVTVADAPHSKYDKTNSGLIRQLTSPLGPFNNWGLSKNEGLLFPKQRIQPLSDRTTGESYQIQIFNMLYTHDLIELGINDIITNKVVKEYNKDHNNMRAESKSNNQMPATLNPVDFIIWNHGIHDQPRWYVDNIHDTLEQIGEKFYKTMLRLYLDKRKISKTPMVWLSMNNECYVDEMKTDGDKSAHLHHNITGAKALKHVTDRIKSTHAHDLHAQVRNVNSINHYLHTRLHVEKVPYFDAASVTRSPQRCQIAANLQDIVHIPLWMEMIKAKIFLNYVCDEQFNWLGDVDRGVMSYMHHCDSTTSSMSSFLVVPSSSGVRKEAASSVDQIGPEPCNSSINTTEMAMNDDHSSSLVVSKTWIVDCDFMGLFTSSPVRKGDVLCKYTGDILRTVQAMRLKDKSYLMRLGEQCYVDALPHLDVKARYINDCINPSGWNVECKKCPEDQCAYVIALRDIQAGEEIFVDYGKWYWASLKPVRMSDEYLRQNLGECCVAVDEDKVLSTK